MARMTLDEQIAVVRLLYSVHEQAHLGADESTLIELQHEVDERLSTAGLLLSQNRV